MSEKSLSYYQFQKDLDYQVYLQFDDFDFESEVQEVVELMGFQKIEREIAQKKSFDKRYTKVLKINRANARVAQQIGRSDYALDKYGDETISPKGSYNIYRYKDVGMMIYSDSSSLWELGLSFNESKSNELRVILTRFLSFALASSEVVGFWGVSVDEGFVVMKPREANFESIFVDPKKNIIITYDGVREIDFGLKILRLDDALLGETRGMRSEALLSFLSMNTCYMSYSGFELGIKEAIFKLSQTARGIYYPTKHFKPRESSL